MRAGVVMMKIGDFDSAMAVNDWFHTLGCGANQIATSIVRQKVLTYTRRSPPFHSEKVGLGL